MRVNLGLVLVALLAHAVGRPEVANADDLIEVSGIVKSLGAPVAGVAVEATWKDRPQPMSLSPTGSAGKFGLSLSRAQHRIGRSLRLRFFKSGYRPSDYTIRIDDQGRPSDSSIEVELVKPGPTTAGSAESQELETLKSTEGRTLFVLPYEITAGGSSIAEKVNGNLPAHIKYGIATRVGSFYRKAISVQPLSAKTTVTNVDHIAAMGTALNALAVVTGRGALESADNSIILLSEFVLPADADEAMTGNSYVADRVAEAEIANPLLGQKLSDLWAHRTLLALADKELRASKTADEREKIIAYLVAARRKAADEESAQEIDRMIERVGRHTP